ncbi:DUF1302 domain-containing protein [Azospirillum sp. INR13]|uniref:DUF1302 domain-containing protein n=1 Tax=Azospirillum sp. INR13 TaxID=2596919 RepID=UPI00351BF103
MTHPQRSCTYAGRTAAGLGVAMLLLGAASASAFEIPTDNPDLRIRFDNTVRYNLGVRAEGIDSRIANNPNYDESDRKFGRGDVITNRLDILSEFDVAFRERYGLRVTGAFWYDNAYHDTDVNPNPALRGYVSGYNGNRYNSDVRRYYRGPSGELLDAFVYGRVDAGTVPVDVKIGRHVIYWGEGLLFGAHAISYSQAPLDGRKAVSSPGIETKEVFLPVGQVSAKAQLSPNLSIAGQFFLEWDPTRVPAGGTYLAPADFLLGDRLAVGGNRSIPRIGDLEPHNIGNWGVNARYNIESIDSTVGAYYRAFDDYTPWGPQTLPTGYRFVYAKDTKLIGLSFNTIGLGGASIGTEVSYRHNAALNSASISAVDNQGARGNTWHAVANAVWLLDSSPVYDTGNLVVELAYSRLGEVTHNASLYKGRGYGGCVGLSAADGCSTRDYVGIAANFTPQWLQVFPSTDLDLPMTINYGLRGNAPTAGGGNEGVLTWSVGAKLTYQQRHEVTLRYTDQHADGKYANNALIGGNGSPQLNDRGYVSLTYKTSF